MRKRFNRRGKADGLDIIPRPHTHNQGREASSKSSKFAPGGTSEISRDTPNVWDGKWRLPFPGLRTAVGVVKGNVLRGDSSVGRAAALFRESMRRAAIIGTRIAFILLNTGRRQSPRGYDDKEKKPTRRARAGVLTGIQS
jgi:hypothetical protein